MARPIVFVGATLLAAAAGALASVAVSLRGPADPPPPEGPSTPPEVVPRVRQRSRRSRRAREPEAVPRVFSTDITEFELPPGASLSDLISSPDERVRLETARSILRQGSAALPQVRALRPRGSDGEELTRNLALALQRIQRNEGHIDWWRRPATVRMEMRLSAFRMVLPEEMLLVERREFGSAHVKAVRGRVEAGRATKGELALAELEFARVRRDLGELDGAVYSKLLQEHYGAANAWVDELDGGGQTPPARITRYRDQLARLRD